MPSKLFPGRSEERGWNGDLSCGQQVNEEFKGPFLLFSPSLSTTIFLSSLSAMLSVLSLVGALTLSGRALAQTQPTDVSYNGCVCRQLIDRQVLAAGY